MQLSEMQAKIVTMVAMIKEQSGKDAHTVVDKQIAALIVTGAELFGELMLDVKRIADAAEENLTR